MFILLFQRFHSLLQRQKPLSQSIKRNHKDQIIKQDHNFFWVSHFQKSFLG